MPATADNLRDLHLLHQRAKALRDRLASGPKTLAARQAALANRQAELEAAKKALQDSKVQLKKHEHSLQSVDTKIDDFKVKLNQVKKNEEYKALQNQIAHDNAAKAKIEEDMLLCLRGHRNQDGRAQEARGRGETDRRRGRGHSATARRTGRRPHRRSSRSSKRRSSKPRTLIPEEYREKYRRIVGRYGADALAVCENASCHGCFTSLTSQMINDLINGEGSVVLPELRPASLPDRARGRKHPSNRDIAITEIGVLVRRHERSPSVHRKPSAGAKIDRFSRFGRGNVNFGPRSLPVDSHSSHLIMHRYERSP